MSTFKNLQVKDFLVSGETFDVVLDSEMELLKTVPQPSSEELYRYYESSEYISHTDSNKGLLSYLYQLVKKWSIRNKISLVTQMNSGVGTLLDVGAGTGEFLKYGKDQGWTVSGMEPNLKAAALASEKGILLKNSLEDFMGEQFDVVTLWHVLEHIPDLENTIELLTNLVKPNGSLIIAVPNFNSYDSNYYGAFWAAYDVPRHLWHFSKSSIERLFQNHFKLEKVEPMIFDSFYVSLLSEKYKNNRSFSLNAFWIGLKSNIKAMNSKEYSSHIYCLKKTN